jgi:hypothetical protein
MPKWPAVWHPPKRDREFNSRKNHMKNLIRVSLLAALSAALSFGQLYTQNSTTLSAASAAGATNLTLASVTNVVVTNSQASPNVGTVLYIVDPGQIKGDLCNVTAVNTTTKVVGVRCGMGGSIHTAHVNAALVIISLTGNIKPKDPQGSCVTASTNETPWINSITGAEWLCSTITLSWVPGWDNPYASPGVTTLVASVAGATAINSPLQHINGTNAITSFTMSVGWNGNNFCVIPDAAFTTTATNNILKASTAVAAKTLCFQWDATNSGFTPSY